MLQKVLLWLLLFIISCNLFADENSIQVIQNEEEAQKLFCKSFDSGEEYDIAILGYQAVIDFYEKQQESKYNVYMMYALQNLAILYTKKNQIDDAIVLWYRALKCAQKVENHQKVKEFHYLLGNIYAYREKLSEGKEPLLKIFVEARNPFLVQTKKEFCYLQIKLRSDFAPEESYNLNPDIFTLGGIPIISDQVFKIGQGNHTLIIEKKGYFPIKKNLDLVSFSGSDFIVLDEILVSKPRKIQVPNLNSSASIVIGTEKIENGQKIKPGTYFCAIKEKGFRSIFATLEILPSEEPYEWDVERRPIPISVQYDFCSDFDNQKVIPDVITLDGTILSLGNSYLPGTYTLVVEKLGYCAKKLEIVLEPSDTVYRITGVLEAIPREIELDISGDFPSGENIDPDIITLNGKDVRDHSFKPGNYELKVENPGYISVCENIVISPSLKPFLIQKILTTTLRKIDINIGYDIEPTPALAPYKLTLTPINQPKNIKEYQNGDIIKPASYILKIQKPGYETIEVNKHVWPGEEPFFINESMIAKHVALDIRIHYNILPMDTTTCRLLLVSPQNDIPILVDSHQQVKPGIYTLSAIQPGYSDNSPKNIQVEPSEEIFVISKTLTADASQILFRCVDPKTKIIVQPWEIINLVTGKKVTSKDAYLPGVSISFRIKFKKYQTVEITTSLEPGKKLQIISVPLVQLQSLEFALRKKEIILDGITYPFVFSIDNQYVEEHLVSCEKSLQRFYYSIMKPSNSRYLKIYDGYLFKEKDLHRLSIISSLHNWNGISIPKLIEHLNCVHKNDKEGDGLAILNAIERILRSYRERRLLQECSPKELQELKNFLCNYASQNLSMQKRWQMVIEIIEGM